MVKSDPPVETIPLTCSTQSLPPVKGAHNIQVSATGDTKRIFEREREGGKKQPFRVDGGREWQFRWNSFYLCFQLQRWNVKIISNGEKVFVLCEEAVTTIDVQWVEWEHEQSFLFTWDEMAHSVVAAILLSFSLVREAISIDLLDANAMGQGEIVSQANGANASGNIQRVDMMRVFENSLSLSFTNRSDSITLMCQNPQVVPRPTSRSICDVKAADAAFWMALLITYITTLAILVGLCTRRTLRNNIHAYARETRDRVNITQPSSIDLAFERSTSRVVMDSWMRSPTQQQIKWHVMTFLPASHCSTRSANFLSLSLSQ